MRCHCTGVVVRVFANNPVAWQKVDCLEKTTLTCLFGSSLLCVLFAYNQLPIRLILNELRYKTTLAAINC